MTQNRRQMLVATGAALFGTSSPCRALAAEKGSPKKVLCFTKSAEFQHSVIARQGDKPAHAERILTELGKEHGFEVVASKDGRLFDPDKIGEWDAFVFVTTGDLTRPGTDQTQPMSMEGKQAFLEAIHGGKGFVGMHCATDTFHSHGDTIDPYIQMIGGEFIIHGAQHVARLDVYDPHFPGAKALGNSFKINDEWYALKNLADDLHVIIGYHTESMQGKMYQRPDFPETWARLHGKGRVFYTSMGHREDVWENPLFQGLVVGGLSWATGKVNASVEPHVRKVTPGSKQLSA